VHVVHRARTYQGLLPICPSSTMAQSLISIRGVISGFESRRSR
jgi:hypothetical protein